MKINHHIIITTLLAFYLSMRLANAQGNLIVNGSFEDNGGSFNGWTLIQSILNSDGYQIGPVTSVDASNIPDGNHFAEFLPATPTGNGELMQTISTTPGVFYAVSLSAIQFVGTNMASVKMLAGTYTGNQVQPAATLIGTLNFTTPSQSPGPAPGAGFVNSINTIWQNFNYTFQATSSTTTLFFDYYRQAIDVQDGATVDVYYGAGGFDNISVTAAPEPSSIALLGAGVVGWLACRKRRAI